MTLGFHWTDTGGRRQLIFSNSSQQRAAQSWHLCDTGAVCL